MCHPSSSPQIPSAAAARPPDALHPHGKTTAVLLHKLGVALAICASPMPNFQRCKLLKDIGLRFYRAANAPLSVTIRCTECGTVAQFVSGRQVLLPRELVVPLRPKHGHPKQQQSLSWQRQFGKLNKFWPGLMAGNLRSLERAVPQGKSVFDRQGKPNDPNTLPPNIDRR